MVVRKFKMEAGGVLVTDLNFRRLGIMYYLEVKLVQYEMSERARDYFSERGLIRPAHDLTEMQNTYYLIENSYWTAEDVAVLLEMGEFEE